MSSDGSAGRLKQYTTCPKCQGQGVLSVYVGNLGGTVGCDLCDGDGRIDLEGLSDAQ